MQRIDPVFARIDRKRSGFYIWRIEVWGYMCFFNCSFVAKYLLYLNRLNQYFCKWKIYVFQKNILMYMYTCEYVQCCWQNLQVVPVPKEYYGEFYRGDSYIILSVSTSSIYNLVFLTVFVCMYVLYLLLVCLTVWISLPKNYIHFFFSWKCNQKVCK
jgi:hypothetical protein